MPLHLRLAIVFSAAVMVGAVNHRYIANRLNTEYFVGVRSTIQPMTRLKEDNLVPIPLGGDLAAARGLLLPWEERAMYYEAPVLRRQPGGGLLVRRDVEFDAFEIYQPLPGEMKFTVDLWDELQPGNYNIGARFYVLTESVDSATREATSHKLGPFTLRQIGYLSKQVDVAVLADLSEERVTLSMPEEPGRQMPVDAMRLLEAVEGVNGSRVYSVIGASE